MKIILSGLFILVPAALLGIIWGTLVRGQARGTRALPRWIEMRYALGLSYAAYGTLLSLLALALMQLGIRWPSRAAQLAGFGGVYFAASVLVLRGSPEPKRVVAAYFAAAATLTLVFATFIWILSGMLDGMGRIGMGL